MNEYELGDVAACRRAACVLCAVQNSVHLLVCERCRRKLYSSHVWSAY